jgi:hypothetical protein
MINKEDFRKIKTEVDSAIEEVFQYAKQHEKNENDFILFLSNAEFIERYVGTNINPHVVDYRINGYRDEERLKFLVEYLNNAYSFKTENSTDTKTSITIELMIYTHLWESKPFLRQLKKLANICNAENYDWKVEVPDFTKHTFIREKIRDIFGDKELKIETIMSKGYHSSLRNAFAHSEYVFDMNRPELILTNFKGNNWEVEKISYDDWTVRFCYSFLLSYGFQERFEVERANLLNGEPGYNVSLKRTDGTDGNGLMVYDKERNAFTAKLV